MASNMTSEIFPIGQPCFHLYRLFPKPYKATGRFASSRKFTQYGSKYVKCTEICNVELCSHAPTSPSFTEASSEF